MTAISERLLQRSAETGVPLSPVQSAQLTAYFELLRRWNPRINLTSLSLDALSGAEFDRLLIEPIAAAPNLTEAVGSWFDLGSGGGSPAVPLKIMKPALRLTMVEAKSRKCAFLREAVRTVGLPSTEVLQARIEELTTFVPADSLDLITARAVRLDEGVRDTCVRLLAPSGLLAVFAGGAPAHITGTGLISVSSLELQTFSAAWLHLYTKV